MNLDIDSKLMFDDWYLIIQPKGRAIQVEDSTVERQPSIDVRRPRNRDFNVIEVCIQSVH